MLLWRRALTLLALLPGFAAAGEPVSLAQKPLDTPPGVVSGPAARALVKAGAVLVDVRTRAEYDAGHGPGAKHVPYHELAARISEIGDPKTPVVVYCRTGRRSGIAVQTLKKLGFEKVWDMQTVERWSEAQ